MIKYIIMSLVFIGVFTSMNAEESETYKMIIHNNDMYLLNTEIGVVYKYGSWTYDNSKSYHSGFALLSFVYPNGITALPIEKGGVPNPYIEKGD